MRALPQSLTTAHVALHFLAFTQPVAGPVVTCQDPGPQRDQGDLTQRIDGVLQAILYTKPNSYTSARIVDPSGISSIIKMAAVAQKSIVGARGLSLR